MTSFFLLSKAQNDPFRLVRYDISTASHGLTQSQPLLLRRHNAVPGMFLVSSFEGFVGYIHCSLIQSSFKPCLVVNLNIV